LVLKWRFRKLKFLMKILKSLSTKVVN
jgi:hypothetical protein